MAGASIGLVSLLLPHPPGADDLALYSNVGGGEEFTLVLSNLPPAEATQVLERLRHATPGGQSCSAGAAWWDGKESGAELLGRADTALYRAKATGRDQAVLLD